MGDLPENVVVAYDEVLGGLRAMIGILEGDWQNIMQQGPLIMALKDNDGGGRVIPHLWHALKSVESYLTKDQHLRKTHENIQLAQEGHSWRAAVAQCANEQRQRIQDNSEYRREQRLRAQQKVNKK